MADAFKQAKLACKAERERYEESRGKFSDRMRHGVSLETQNLFDEYQACITDEIQERIRRTSEQIRRQ
eukprot:CAMPEP_0182467750 /NCGR_PEP_ID=MMETSP1319-20130603/14508_1 /TAXON_ID=172717 /ORGANISM="Bolidomonas pacifica, Strain RCC208" /LENGTH=67 /DNA_ID=CAMNT_0024667875 /DNA_START=23 /DNA_END=223 /DNA_ORIENTATION=-